jgi:prepilin-type N-terminal cleavage/methylation domain-containing protein
MRRAFTMIELLVVIAIVLVLAGLLLPATQAVLHRTRVTATTVRIDGLLRQLGQIGEREGSVAYALQVAAGLPGVRAWKTDPLTLAASVYTGAYLDVAQPHLFGYPWGKPDLIRALPAVASDPDADATLAQLDPTLTPAWIRVSGVAEGAADPIAAWRSDRGTKKPWNDAWGHPLIVAYGMFQPGAPPANPPKGWSAAREAMRQYQYSRSVYLSVGACGPELPAGLEPTSDWSDTAVLRATWTAINAGVQDRPELVWNAAAWAKPPWQGVRAGDAVVGGVRLRPQLAAPAEFK